MTIALEEAKLEARLTFQLKVSGFAEAWKGADNHPLTSPDLKVGGATFRLHLKPEGSEAGSRHAAVRLIRWDLGANPVFTWLSATLPKGDGQVVSKSFGKHHWFVPSWAASGDGYHCNNCGWTEFCTEADLLAHVSLNGDDTVRISARIEVVNPEGLTPPDLSHCLKGVVNTKAVMKGIQELVKLRASNEFEVSLPKVLLCQVSDVFKAELNSCMREGATAILEIRDANKRQLEDFALCIETGGLSASVTTCLDRIVDVLMLADKYQVLGLADACLWALSIAMSQNSAARLLKLAEQHNLSKLYRTVLRFAASSAQRTQALMNSDEFSAFRADTVRDLLALAWPRQRAASTEVKEEDVPPFLQWGSAVKEFGDDTNWKALTANDLRRACLERGLATTGTAGELACRLGSGGETGATGSPGASIPKTSEPSTKRIRVTP